MGRGSTSKIVGSNKLCEFEHLAGCCCWLFVVVGYCCVRFEIWNSSKFEPTSPKIYLVWGSLNRSQTIMRLSNCTILTVSPPIYAIGEKKPEKNSGLQWDSNPWPPRNSGAILYQLSYEATHWEPGHFCGFYLSQEGNRWKSEWNYFARRREASICTILTVSPPIYSIGEKKPEKIQGFNGIRTRDLREIPLRCSTNRTMKPHIGSQVIFVGSIFPMKEIDERIK